MQNARLQTQKSTAPTELTTPARADAGSSLNGLVRSTPRYWIGWAALVVGIGAVVASITLTSTPAGQGLTLGFAAFIAFFALLSLLARNQTPTLWGLFVAGFVLFLLPWLGEGFVPDPAAAWTAWVVGFLAMAVGAVGWLSSRPPTVYGINENTSSQTRPSAVAGWISRAALVVGLGAVVLGATVVQSSPAAVAVTVGLGGFTAVIAMWSMLAADPTRDYFTLAVVGLRCSWRRGSQLSPATRPHGPPGSPALSPRRSVWPAICAVNPLTLHGPSAPTPTRGTTNDSADFNDRPRIRHENETQPLATPVRRRQIAGQVLSGRFRLV